jgi:hypothetical protein
MDDLKGLEALSSRLKVDKESLAKAILEGEELELPNILTDEELDHIKKAKHDAAKLAGEEMLVKEFKKEVAKTFEIDTEGIKKPLDLLSKVLETKETEWKKTSKNSESEEINRLTKLLETEKKDKKKLGETLKQAEENHNNQLNDALGKVKKKDIDNYILSVTNSMNFDIPKHISTQGDEATTKFIQTENKKFQTLFNNFYNFDIIDNTHVALKDGEPIKDKYEKYIPISQLALEFAKQMNFNLIDKKSYKRDSGSKKYGNEFAGMPEQDFKNWAEQEGIHPLSNQFNTYYLEWQKANT